MYLIKKSSTTEFGVIQQNLSNSHSKSFSCCFIRGFIACKASCKRALLLGELCVASLISLDLNNAIFPACSGTVKVQQKQGPHVRIKGAKTVSCTAEDEEEKLYSYINFRSEKQILPF